ncbi:hypothetical protein BFJ69_g14458 [Fusarium oxysporum]|uniref:Myb-like domain-containing protein n=1 Tax=Fusarium oxysporum TaxID=5507 RepID=A0A420MHK4_FUSOX|nr:hypothetical protein BFJ69_g14458 [Fusarium oxysporum]
MALKFKPYDPVQHQRQAKQRRQKRSAGRSTLPPISTTYSAIDTQDASSDSSYQDDGYKDDELSQKLLVAIASTPSTSALNIRESAFNVTALGTPAPITVSAEQSDRGISPVEHALSSDAKSIPSTASSISTSATGTPPIYQEQASTWRNQDSFVDNKDGAQDSSAMIPDLGGLDPTSKDALSGVALPVLEYQNNTTPEFLSPDSSSRLLSQDIQGLRFLASAASTIEESITKPSVTEPSISEPSSAEKTPAQDAASSSTKRSFSESATISDSQPSNSEVCKSSKRPRLTSISSEEAVSTLFHIQNMISNLLAKLNQDQPHSLILDVSVQSMSDTIQVAVDGVGDDSGDDSSSAGSSFDDSDSETELTTSQPQGFQHRSTQRRRWTKNEEKLLRRLKSTQKRNKGTPSDCEIASRLDRTESGVKQHWGIMLQKNGGKY